MALVLGAVALACCARPRSRPLTVVHTRRSSRPGPPLSVPTSKLHAAAQLHRRRRGRQHATRSCSSPGRTSTPGPNYSWNYERAFAALHWPYCTVTLPYQTTGDIQIAGEYVVYALRTMAHVSGRQVDVLGYSQGGMLPRWALRFWPDTRPLVHDLVALDPSNHGTLDANAACQQQCSPPTGSRRPARTSWARSTASRRRSPGSTTR